MGHFNNGVISSIGRIPDCDSGDQGSNPGYTPIDKIGVGMAALSRDHLLTKEEKLERRIERLERIVTQHRDTNENQVNINKQLLGLIKDLINTTVRPYSIYSSPGQPGEAGLNGKGGAGGHAFGPVKKSGFFDRLFERL